jgi:hypothetical protein
MEQIPRLGEAIDVVVPEDETAQKYYDGRHWKDVDLDHFAVASTSLSSFTNQGLRYYIVPYLLRILAIDAAEANPQAFADAVATFDHFLCSPDSLKRIEGATHDQIGCIVSTAIFMQENQGIYRRTLLDHEIDERDQALARWMQAWRGN